jgi:hypothetical protein
MAGFQGYKPLKHARRVHMSDKAGREIRRVWGDLDVVDAKRDVVVTINEADIARASRQDPAECVFAQACRRVFGAKKVLFFRSVAYIEMPDAQGRRRVERFILGHETRDLINQWDDGEQVFPDAGFQLRAPSRSQTFDTKLAKSRKEHLKVRKRVLEGARIEPPGVREKPELRPLKPAKASAGPVEPSKPMTASKAKAAMQSQPKAPEPTSPGPPPGIGAGKGRYRDEPRLIDMVADPVRNGSGAVHFTARGIKVVPTTGLPAGVNMEANQ